MLKHKNSNVDALMLLVSIIHIQTMKWASFNWKIPTAFDALNLQIKELKQDTSYCRVAYKLQRWFKIMSPVFKCINTIPVMILWRGIFILRSK